MATYGVAYVEVAPDLRSFLPKLKAEMAGLDPKVTVRGDTKPVDDELRRLPAKARKAGAESGEALAGELRGRLKDLGGKLAPILGGAALVAFAVKSAGAFRELGGEVLSLNRLVGGTVESSSRLRFAAQQTGVEIGALGAGMRVLSRQVATGGAALDKYGVSTKTAGGATRDIDDILGQLADRYVALAPGIERTAFVQEVFGRGGAALGPLLSKGADGIKAMGDEARKLGLVLDPQAVKALREATKAQRDFEAAGQALSVEVGRSVLPQLTRLKNLGADALRWAAQKPGLGEVTVGAIALGGALGTVGPAITTVNEGIQLFRTLASVKMGRIVALIGLNRAQAASERAVTRAVIERNVAESAGGARGLFSRGPGLAGLARGAFSLARGAGAVVGGTVGAAALAVGIDAVGQAQETNRVSTEGAAFDSARRTIFEYQRAKERARREGIALSDALVVERRRTQEAADAQTAARASTAAYSRAQRDLGRAVAAAQVESQKRVAGLLAESSLFERIEGKARGAGDLLATQRQVLAQRGQVASAVTRLQEAGLKEGVLRSLLEQERDAPGTIVGVLRKVGGKGGEAFLDELNRGNDLAHQIANQLDLALTRASVEAGRHGGEAGAQAYLEAFGRVVSGGVAVPAPSAADARRAGIGTVPVAPPDRIGGRPVDSRVTQGTGDGRINVYVGGTQVTSTVSREQGLRARGSGFVR